MQTKAGVWILEGPILPLLDQEGICASSGSVCTSGSLEPSHLLRAMGISFTFAHGSISPFTRKNCVLVG